MAFWKVSHGVNFFDQTDYNYDDWEQRNYEVIKLTVLDDKIYKTDYKKGWTPNFF